MGMKDAAESGIIEGAEGCSATFSFLFGRRLGLKGVSLVAQVVKNLPAMQKTQLQSQSQVLRSMGSQRVGHDLATEHILTQTIL